MKPEHFIYKSDGLYYIPESAPKKEEESEAQLLHYLLNDYTEYQQEVGNGGTKSFYDFMAEELEKFEIKRKPL